jgi:hypothetical protein
MYAADSKGCQLAWGKCVGFMWRLLAVSLSQIYVRLRYVTLCFHAPPNKEWEPHTLLQGEDTG